MSISPDKRLATGLQWGCILFTHSFTSSRMVSIVAAICARLWRTPYTYRGSSKEYVQCMTFKHEPFFIVGAGGGGGGGGGGVFVVLYGKSLGTNCIWVYACMHMHEFGTHTWCIAHTTITPFMHGKCVDHAQLLTAF